MVSAATVLLPTVGLAAGARGVEAGEASMTLEARDGRVQIAPAPAPMTDVWGYAGMVPGPLIRIRKGEPVHVRLVNHLPQPTSISWHGVRISNAEDGVADLTQKPVLPGQTFDYRFTPPDAGLFWYHPRIVSHEAEQVGRGLYGVLIVEELDPPKVDRDLLIVLDEWGLDAKAAIEERVLEAPGAPTDGPAPVITVNTRPTPMSEIAQPGARIRVRLLNACIARICVVSFDKLAPMIIAVDGQPSEIFQPMRATVPIGPGSRFEVMVDLPGEAGKEASLILRGDGVPDISLVVFKTLGAADPARPAIAKLPANLLLPARIPLERSLRREIVIGAAEALSSKSAASKTSGKAVKPVAPPEVKTGPNAPEPRWVINNTAFDGFSVKPLFTIARGNAVTLTFVNKTASVQQMHIHGHVWRLLHDLDDGWDPYWRDSVLLVPGKTKHVAFIADNPGKWLIASSILDQRTSELMTWFEVL